MGNSDLLAAGVHRTRGACSSREPLRSLPPLRTAAQAAASTDELERLMAHAVDWVARSVRTSVAMFSPVDRRLNLFTQGPLVVRHDASVDLDVLERGRREYLEHVRALDPFAPARWARSANAVIGIADVGGAQAFARSSYREFIASLGMTSQTSMFLRERGRIVAAIVLLRRSGELEPTPSELRLLQATQPLLEQTLALAGEASPAPLSEPAGAVGLTPREFEVARLAAAGATNAEIGLALFVSIATVKTHMTHVLAKTGVRSRRELFATLRRQQAVATVE